MSKLSTSERLQLHRNALITDQQRARRQADECTSPITAMSLSLAWRRLCMSERVLPDDGIEMNWARYLQELAGTRGLA